MSIFGLLIFVFGLLLLTVGNRLAVLGAGVGALLGLAFLVFLPGAQDNLLWLVIPIGLAIVFALGSGLAKGAINLVTLALGALAGGAVILAVLDLFRLDFGLVNWLLALVGAVVGAGLMAKFKDWGVIILASLVGALLCTRGLQMMVPTLSEMLASLVGVVLLVGGIIYQGKLFGKK